MLDNDGPEINPNETAEFQEAEQIPETKEQSPTKVLEGITERAHERSSGIKGLFEKLRGKSPQVDLRGETEEMQEQDDNLKALSEYTASQLPSPKPTEKLSRLRLASHLHAEMLVRTPHVTGVENLTSLPKNKGVVIAATHLSDIDLEAITADVSKYRAASVTSQSSNQEIPLYGGFMRFAAGNEIYDISGSFNRKTGKAEFKVDPTNFESMKEPLDRGRAMIVAAHNPAYNWQLPDKPGLGAVLAAQQLEEPTIVPAALDIDTQSGTLPAAIVADVKGTMKRLATGNRPDTRLAYGKPIHLEKIETEKLNNMMRLFSAESRHGLSETELLESKQTLQKISDQAKEVMRSLAALLPSEKRGSWGSFIDVNEVNEVS